MDLNWPDATRRQAGDKTLRNKGWFTYFRLYGPTQAYFDKSWVLPDIEPMKWSTYKGETGPRDFGRGRM